MIIPAWEHMTPQEQLALMRKNYVILQQMEFEELRGKRPPYHTTDERVFALQHGASCVYLKICDFEERLKARDEK